MAETPGRQQNAPEHTDASVWARPYAARERVILSVQAKYDRRNIPHLWLGRLLRPEGGGERLPAPDPSPQFDPIAVPGGTVIDDVLFESPRVNRRYADPIAAHIYVDWSPKQKGRRKGAVETTLTAQVSMSRAEGRRLGKLLQTQDDLEGLISTGEADYLFLPRPGDIFRFADDHFEILQWNPPDFYGPTNIPVVWKGTANLFREDSTAPHVSLPEPPSPQPPRPQAPRGAWRG
jgi:hypothetical protein